MSMKGEFLDKSLSDLENKTKKLSFCKTILGAKDIFAIKTAEIDKGILTEITDFVKEMVGEYTESVISDSAFDKDKKNLTEEDWQVLRGLIDQVKLKMPKKEPVEAIVEPVKTVQPTIRKRKNKEAVLHGTGVMLPESNAAGGISDVVVNVIVSNHAIMETRNAFKSDIPLNESVKVLEDVGEYYRCLYVNGQSGTGNSRNIVFKIPKEDVETI